jgi:hypothetical protein
MLNPRLFRGFHLNKTAAAKFLFEEQLGSTVVGADAAARSTIADGGSVAFDAFGYAQPVKHA